MSHADNAATTEATSGDASFAKRFLALFALGMVGVLAVGVSTATGEGGVPGLPEVSGPALAALVMLEPAISIAVGLVLAPRVGLRSLVDERVRGGSPVLGALRPTFGVRSASGTCPRWRRSSTRRRRSSPVPSR